jgi:hypothetical protein
VAPPLLDVHPLALADQSLLCLDCYGGLDDGGFDADHEPLVVHQQGSLEEGLRCVRCFYWWGLADRLVIGGLLVPDDVEVRDALLGCEVASSRGQWVYWPR